MIYHHFTFLFFTALLFIENESTGRGETYDFVVVGAGSAGAPLTNRLSGYEDYTVLLLDKGPFYPDPIAQVPALAPAMFNTPSADWYPVEKQDNAGLGLIDQQQIWYKGRGLGGTSLLNYMAYTWAHREYFNRWGALNPGWSFKDVLPHLQDIETSHIRTSKPEIQNIRGSDGELDCIIPSKRYAIGDAFVKACQQYGIKFLEDSNAQDLYGIGYFQANIRNGRRLDTGKAFLYDIADRPNLTIRNNSTVTKLIINPRTKRVEQVEYVQGSQTKRVRVRKGVGVSAGTVASPQLLMVSGIGPKKHLEELGIKVIKDLRVGQKLFDHIIFPGLFFPINDSSAAPNFMSTQNPEVWRQFLEEGKGPLTVPSLALEAIGYIKTPVSNETIDYPDIELLYMSGSYNMDMGTNIRKEWRISKESYDTLWLEYEGKPVWSVFPMLFSPLSSGYLKLTSPNLLDKPKIYANYLSDPGNMDVKTLIAAIRIIKEIAKQPALAKYGSQPVLKPLPACKDKEVDSDEFWECQIRQIAGGVWHHTGSCRMGPKDDPDAVVDNKLRVYGMENLWVADTSVFPFPIVGHPSVVSMMVGSRLAEFMVEKASQGHDSSSKKHDSSSKEHDSSSKEHDSSSKENGSSSKEHDSSSKEHDHSSSEEDDK